MQLATPTLRDSKTDGGDETVTSLIYVSSAVSLFSAESLSDLLKKARVKNACLGITGMLLYKGGNFMQVLEGPGQAVRNLYSEIAQDPRHRGAFKLMEYSAKERHFSNWTMGFTNLDGVTPIQYEGYTDILNQPLDAAWFRDDASRAQRLLLSFRKNM
jgi:hypothetical protein